MGHQFTMLLYLNFVFYLITIYFEYLKVFGKKIW